MIAGEPRVRRRGFFLHSTDVSESDAAHGAEHDAEGLTVRVRVNSRPSVPRQVSSGRSRSSAAAVEDHNPQIRSGSVTGSRQRAHLPR